MNTDFDIAIVGSGFAGSLMAMIAKRLGRSVILLESGRHPRFAIGESSTPMANLLLERLATTYDLPEVFSLTEWGRWQSAHPELACGLKRGFSFYHHQMGKRFAPTACHTNELLVAASPCDLVADTHWYRPDFDKFLAEQAAQLGVEFVDEVKLRLDSCYEDGCTLHGNRPGSEFRVSAKLVIDATGPRGFLHSAFALPESAFEHLPTSEALFTHFRGVHCWEELGVCNGDTPPFPPDDAALHHVFPGGWVWVLRFNNGITSAGISATKALAEELGLCEGAKAWSRLLDRFPSLSHQFRDAVPVLDFIHRRRLPFLSAQTTGPGWLMLPSAAAFIDPLLSTGFPLTLIGIGRIAEIIKAHWGSPSLPLQLSRYGTLTTNDAQSAGELVAALFRHMDSPAVFNAITKLYFAAASYSETMWRLRQGDFWQPFLGQAGEQFAIARDTCLKIVFAHPKLDAGPFIERVHNAVAPIDIAGLVHSGVANDDGSRLPNWHPVDFDDLLNNAHKLRVPKHAVETMVKELRERILASKTTNNED